MNVIGQHPTHPDEVELGGLIDRACNATHSDAVQSQNPNPMRRGGHYSSNARAELMAFIKQKLDEAFAAGRASR